jgi:hypothetical protein
MERHGETKKSHHKNLLLKLINKKHQVLLLVEDKAQQVQDPKLVTTELKVNQTATSLEPQLLKSNNPRKSQQLLKCHTLKLNS